LFPKAVRSVEKSAAPLWLWPNLLSLDAPLIALVWQGFLGQVVGEAPGISERLVLGLTVWAIYLFDRVLDVGRAAPPGEAARHQFYRRHRNAAYRLFWVLVAVDIAIALWGLGWAVIRNGLVVIAGVGLYLGLWHGWGRGSPVGRLGKEVVVAVLFTAGTFLVAWTKLGSLLWQEAVAFGTICLLNLVAIEDWESGGGRGMAVAAAAAGLAIWCWMAKDGSGWYEAIGLSAVLMLCLLAAARRVSMELRRALVDAVLLTPLLIYATGWLV
jgi:hypothetical protein